MRSVNAAISVADSPEIRVRGNERATLTRLPINCPNAHQTESTVRRYWCDAGTNSRDVEGEKIAIGRAAKMLAKEDGGVDGKIPTYTDAPNGCERAQRDVPR